jgi:CBS domain-containing protein
MARLVRDLMTTRVVTVGPHDPVPAAVDRMTRYGFSALPVVSDSSRLLGVVSLLDVIRFREDHPDEGADVRATVGEIMTGEVLSMQATAGVAAVAQRLRSHGELRMMPVVQGGRLVGVITRSDLLRGRDRTPRPSGLRRLLGARDREEEDAIALLARERRTGPRPAADTPITEIMTREVDTASPGDPLHVAAELMLHHRHSALPVVDASGELVGIVSEADILGDPHAGRGTHALVGRVMTRNPITIGTGATAGEARALVADRGLRLVPVVEGTRLAGVVSRSDLL